MVDITNAKHHEKSSNILDTNPQEPKNVLVKAKSKRLMFLITTFVVLCVGMAMIQTTFYIPVFSDIFSPKQVQPEVVKISCKFEKIDSTDKQIQFSIVVDNNLDDYASQNIHVYLVKTSVYFDDCLNNFDEKTKKLNRINVTTKKFNANFYQSLGTSGNKENLLAQTSYTLVVTQNDDVILTQEVKTKAKVFVDSISKKIEIDNEFGPNRYLKFRPELNSSFSDFLVLYVELLDADTNALIMSTTMTKQGLEEGGWWLYTKLKTDTASNYKALIYCSTEHPEQFNFAQSKIVDGVTYYLIYSQNEIMVF